MSLMYWDVVNCVIELMLSHNAELRIALPWLTIFWTVRDWVGAESSARNYESRNYGSSYPCEPLRFMGRPACARNLALVTPESPYTLDHNIWRGINTFC